MKGYYKRPKLAVIKQITE